MSLSISLFSDSVLGVVIAPIPQAEIFVSTHLEYHIKVIVEGDAQAITSVQFDVSEGQLHLSKKHPLGVPQPQGDKEKMQIEIYLPEGVELLLDGSFDLPIKIGNLKSLVTAHLHAASSVIAEHLKAVALSADGEVSFNVRSVLESASIQLRGEGIFRTADISGTLLAAVHDTSQLIIGGGSLSQLDITASGVSRSNINAVVEDAIIHAQGNGFIDFRHSVARCRLTKEKRAMVNIPQK